MLMKFENFILDVPRETGHTQYTGCETVHIIISGSLNFSCYIPSGDRERKLNIIQSTLWHVLMIGRFNFNFVAIFLFLLA